MGDLIGCFAKVGLLDSGYGGRAALDVRAFSGVPHPEKLFWVCTS